MLNLDSVRPSRVREVNGSSIVTSNCSKVQHISHQSSRSINCSVLFAVLVNTVTSHKKNQIEMTRRNTAEAKKYFCNELFPRGLSPELLDRGTQAVKDVLDSSAQSLTLTLQAFKEGQPDAKQKRCCTTTLLSWLALGQCLSRVGTPRHSQHMDVVFDLLVKRLTKVRSALIPLWEEDTESGYKYLFAVEITALAMANMLCGCVSTGDGGPVDFDRLDALLLGWVGVFNCHHLTDPTKPFLAFARYLQATSDSGRQKPGTYNKLVEGFANAARSRHTGTAGIAAAACLILAETMRHDGDVDGRTVQQGSKRSAGFTADHCSLSGDCAKDKWGRLSGLSAETFPLTWRPTSGPAASLLKGREGALAWLEHACQQAGVVAAVWAHQEQQSPWRSLIQSRLLYSRSVRVVPVQALDDGEQEGREVRLSVEKKVRT